MVRRIQPMGIVPFLILAIPIRAENFRPPPEPGEMGTPGPSLSAQNENFVVTAPTQDLADELLLRAESLREEIAQKWLGKKLPPNVGPTVIRLKLSETEDKALTWIGDRPDRLSHLMWLTTSRQKALGNLLAHELTHTVLATRYPGQLPAWLHEGIASQSDEEERKETRRDIIQWYAETENWPSLLDAFLAERIARVDQARYAVAESITKYLLTLGDAKQLLEFALAGKHTGDWDSGVKKYYELENVRALEEKWRVWTQK